MGFVIYIVNHIIQSNVCYQNNMSYHLRKIQTQGVFGQTSKIREELEELEESLEQNNHILALCELADLYGAVEGVAENLNCRMEDIIKMAAATKRAFESGSRKGKE